MKAVSHLLIDAEFLSSEYQQRKDCKERKPHPKGDKGVRDVMFRYDFQHVLGVLNQCCN